LLRRQRLGTRRARLAVLEQYSAGTTGLLTERTAKPVRHVAATRPGDLLCLDTFYVGKLKGVGKVWQITGCDAASSFGWARLIVGEVTAAAVLEFLREVVRPTYRQAGWALRRVLTDNGKEFKGVFAAGCERLRLRVTKTKPRHVKQRVITTSYREGKHFELTVKARRRLRSLTTFLKIPTKLRTVSSSWGKPSSRLSVASCSSSSACCASC